MVRRSASQHVTGRPKKRRSPERFSRLGKRIIALGDKQLAIGRILGVTQQTVSKKLLGETGISIVDLEMLAVHYDVHISYFFEDWTPPTRKIRPKRRHGPRRPGK